MSHIFISYSRNDIKLADKIVRALAANEVDTWIDWKSIPKGEDWEQEIYYGIEEANAFLFLISPDSIISEMCNKEVAHAFTNGKRILPIVIREADIENFLFENAKNEISKRNWIFCRDGVDDFEKVIAETCETIHTDFEWLKYHTRLQVKALDWQRYKDGSRLLRGKELREAEQQLTNAGIQKEPQPTNEQRKFLLDSQRNEAGRRNRIVIISTIAGIIMVILGVYGLIQANLANERAQIALARQLAAQAQLIITTRSSKQMISVLLATQSMKIFTTSEAAEVLQDKDFSGYGISVMTHNGLVNSVAFSPDGRYVASSGSDSTRVWEVTSGKEVALLPHGGFLTSVAFSPDSKNVVVSGGWDHTARVWEVATKNEVARITYDGDVTSVAFSPDGKYVVSGGCDKWHKYGSGICFQGTARVWEVATENEVARMIHNGTVTSVAFSPDGKYVVSGGCDGLDEVLTNCVRGIARVWEATTGREVARMNHDGLVTSVAFSPNGKYVVSGSDDHTARVWEVATEKEIARMTHDGGVTSVSFNSDGKFVVSGSTDNTARVWDALTSGEIAHITHDGSVTSVAFSLSGMFVVSGSSDNTARIWETSSGKEVARMTHNKSVTSVVFSPDDKYVVSGSYDQTARVWAMSIGNRNNVVAHDDVVSSVAFSPDGEYVVSSSYDHTVRIWEVTTGREVSRKIHDNTVSAAAFSPDGDYVVSGGCDKWEMVSLSLRCVLGTAHIWEISTGEEIAHTKTHSEIVSTVSFSPDGKYVIFGGDSGVGLWEISTGRETSFINQFGIGTSVAFSPDGKYLVSGEGRSVRVFGAYTGNEVVHMTHDDIVTSVAFSPNGKYVVSGNFDHTIRIWEISDGREIGRMTHDDVVSSVAFSPDGKYVVSGGGLTVQIWEISTGREISRMTHDDVVSSVAFSPDGKYVVSGSHDHTARIWLWKAKDLITNACERIPRNLTRAEWDQYIGTVLTYQAVCENLPIEPGSPPAR